MRILQSEHPRPLNLLAVGAGGRVAAANDLYRGNTVLELWDALTGTLLSPHARQPGGLLALAFANGTRLVHSGLNDIVFDRTHIKFRTGAPTFALYPDNERLVATIFGRTGQQNGVECWRVRSAGTSSQLWCHRFDEHHHCDLPAADPTGERVTAVERYSTPDSRPRQDAVLRNADTGAVTVRIVLDPSDAARQLAFTADGARLLARFDGRAVKVFDAVSGAAAGELVHPRRPFVTAVAVHPHGPVACARADGTVTFWDADRREALRTLDWKAGKLVSLAFSPDGALAAAGTEDGKVVVWDVDV